MQPQTVVQQQNFSSLYSPVFIHPPYDGEIAPQCLPRRAFRPANGADLPMAIIFDYGDQIGVPLTDALSSYGMPQLRDSEDRTPFEVLDIGPKASYNITLQGYAPYIRQKNARRRKNRCSVYPTRREILRQVAEVMQDFILERKDYIIQEPAHIRWQVGPGAIQLENLVVLGLKHVSKSGVQPVLAYRPV